ncbi:MAG: 4-hydroxy-tetrahydrodipicolinate reductase [Polyangiaceae bacterium]|nr:4-hydroxy-tetrahydrodipicolinate reductase [Polyangiaceae bacterium]
MKIAICGATGKMGLSVARLAHGDLFQIVGAIASSGSKHLGRDLGDLAGIGTIGVAVDAPVSSGLMGADVVIDFSTPDALVALVHAAAKQGVAIVSGTTRLHAEATKALENASKLVPVLWAPNTSVGVHILRELAALAAKALGSGFDVEIVETHHRAKVDAPSGTAGALVAAVKAARPELVETRGRDGNVGPRANDELGVFAVRGGDVIGDHTVMFLGQGERIEISHRATNRDLFARGALRAARFLKGKPAGMYTMADVLSP